MKSYITLLLSLVATATAAATVNCPEAARFGVLHVPSSVKSGQSIKITNDLTCAPSKGIRPQVIEYFLDTQNTLQAVLLGRTVLDPAHTPAADVLTVEIPLEADGPDSLKHFVSSQVLYVEEGQDGKPFLLLGRAQSPPIAIH